MTVAVDATGTKLIGGTSVTSINYTGLTVGTGLSNGALVAWLSLGVATTSHGTPTAIWDSGNTNQSMTLIGSATLGTATHACSIYLFALRNPTSGNKTLAFSWTTADFPTVEAMSLTGVEQSNDANAFKNFSGATGTTAAVSTTVTSAVGDMVIGGYSCENFTSMNGTVVFSDTTSNGADSAGNRQAGAATVTVTGNGNASNNKAVAGFDVSAVVPASLPWLMFATDTTIPGELFTTDLIPYD